MLNTLTEWSPNPNPMETNQGIYQQQENEVICCFCFHPEKVVNDRVSSIKIFSQLKNTHTTDLYIHNISLVNCLAHVIDLIV